MIAIVGGGIGGLATAYQLACEGEEFTLYEASDRLGGIVETVHRDGFVIECGPDGWVTEKPWARQLAIELGLEDEIIPSNDPDRKTYVLLGRPLQPSPAARRMMAPADLEALDSSSLFSADAKQAFHNEIARAEELKSIA